MFTLVHAASEEGGYVWLAGPPLSSDIQRVVILYVITPGRKVRSGARDSTRSRGEAMSVAWTERNTSGRKVPRTLPEHRATQTEPREAVLDELSRHPSLLGRLVAIASFRDESAGTYHHRLAAQFGPEEMDRLLRRLHQEALVAWLSLPLRQQQADVTIYLGALGIKAEWFDFRKMGKSCLPETATLPERDLFLLDLDLIQGLLRY